MKKFLTMLLAVLFCTTAMCICDVFAYSNTSTNAQNTKEESIQNSISNIKSAALNTEKPAYSDEEVLLTAQLIHHEAHNQAYNGKVAIAEVVLNRVNSTLFPDSIESVIFQNGQFTSVRRLRNINPTDQEMRIAYRVLNGNLRTLNDEDIMYFRNPKITNGISASLDKNWGSLDYETHIGDHAFYSQENPVALVADKNDTAEKTSIFDKIPGSKVISKFFSAKKNKDKVAKDEKIDDTDKVKPDDSSIEVEVVGEVAVVADASADEIAIATLDFENMTEEEKALAEAKQLESVLSAQYYAQLAEQAEATEINDSLDESSDEKVDEVALLADTAEEALDEAETQEIIDVNNEIYMAQANALTLTMGNAVIAEDTDAEEEYDENDPVAVARHNAYVAEMQKKAERERLLEEERLANANAQKQAVMLDQMNVDRIARENAEMARATNAAVSQVIAMQGK